MLIMAYMHFSLCTCIRFLCSAICQCMCGLAIASTIYNVLSGQSTHYMCPRQSAAMCILVSLLLHVSSLVCSLHMSSSVCCYIYPRQSTATSVLASLFTTCVLVSLPATCVLVSLLATCVQVSLLTTCVLVSLLTMYMCPQQYEC